MMRVAYGTYVAEGPQAGAELVEEIRLVEAAGFDAIFFSEHHGVENYPPSPIQLAGFALGATSRLRAGPMPLLLPLHQPVRVAEDLALLDHVSGGRVVAGLSAGYLPVDFEQIGIPLDERAGRFEEAMEILHQLWRGEPQKFDGRYYQIGGTAPLVYPPYGGRLPELWIASTSGAGMRRAARWGTGIVLDSVQPRADAGRITARFAGICAEQGRPAGPVSAICRVWFGDEAETEQFLDGLATEYRRYLDLAGGTGVGWLKDLRERGVSRETVLERAFAGDPEQVARTMTDWAARSGIEHVILKFQWGKREFARIREQLERARVFCAAVEGAAA
jgi:alkanesulfonate monooxygenase SsuD/methylene tetrahydromethanopterin reductase-like flavin-dependent oxidoreductase (luciferase family)